MDRWGAILRSSEFQLLVGLVLLSVIFVLLYPDTFGTTQNVKNMSTVGGILLVVAIGQSMALLVGGFDLSVSANMGFVSIVASLHMTEGRSIIRAVLVGLAAAAAVAWPTGSSSPCCGSPLRRNPRHAHVPRRLRQPAQWWSVDRRPSRRLQPVRWGRLGPIPSAIGSRR